MLAFIAGAFDTRSVNQEDSIASFVARGRKKVIAAFGNDAYTVNLMLTTSQTRKAMLRLVVSDAPRS